MRQSSERSLLWLCAFAAATLVGCLGGPSRIVYRKALKTEYGKQAGLTPSEKQWVNDNCPLGTPKHRAGVDVGLTRLIVRPGYVLEHSPEEKIPLWVCERVTREQVSGPLRRPKPEPFAPDPKLDKGLRAEMKDYQRSGYDRGHQAPSGDQTVDQEKQNDTYFLSNMCPQRSALNERIWQAIESQVRVLAQATGVVYVVTGPMFYDEAEDDPQTADGYVSYEKIGRNEVAVPTHFFKIVLWRGEGEKWQATAFVMLNQESEFPKPYDFSTYIKSIQWIEERTGFDFDPDLPGPDVGRVERTPGTMWN